MLILSGLLSSCNIATAQSVFKGILWVVPIDSSALPIKGTTTGNEDLNRIFEKFHVEKYYFLDSFSLYSNQVPVYYYEICLEEEFAHLEYDLLQELFFCYQKDRKLFSSVCSPTRHGTFINLFSIIDPSLAPCSSTRSCNEQINSILDRYEVYGYLMITYISHEDTVKDILIACALTDIIALYKDILPLNDMFEIVNLNCWCQPPDISYPCEYIGISSENSPPLIVYPNPATDYIDISGISPQIITLYDLQGRIVLTKTNSNYIEIGHLPKGLYFLHIFSDKGDFFAQKLNKM